MGDPDWDRSRIILIVLRALALMPGIFFAIYNAPLYLKLNHPPLPEDIPHREDIYLSLQVLGPLVRR